MQIANTSNPFVQRRDQSQRAEKREDRLTKTENPKITITRYLTALLLSFETSNFSFMSEKNWRTRACSARLNGAAASIVIAVNNRGVGLHIDSTCRLQ